MKTLLHNIAPGRQLTVAQGEGVSDAAFAALERRVANLKTLADSLAPAKINELVALAIRPFVAELALQEKETQATVAANAKATAKLDDWSGYDLNSMMEH